MLMTCISWSAEPTDSLATPVSFSSDSKQPNEINCDDNCSDACLVIEQRKVRFTFSVKMNFSVAT